MSPTRDQASALIVLLVALFVIVTIFAISTTTCTRAFHCVVNVQSDRP